MSDGTNVDWAAERIVAAVQGGQPAPATPVSFDGGRSWLPADRIVSGLRARGDDAVGLVVPIHTEPWSVVAGYVALFSLLFFGGPIAALAVVAAFDPGPRMAVRLGAVAVGLLLGPLPIAFVGWLALRGLRKDPTYRGKGRAIFSLVVAGLLTALCLVGLVGLIVR
jgi:hypothetical protein